ncbi:MAG: hypothetical protein VX379_11315 [Pseudomonadota bacterium]|nr:hypothetical protein [Alcanivorax sp.]MED5240154.1 hypothetical protein [Pseudomonadota bacterium]MEE3319317.1 hypothetical protein [Pseudomonadota bacterium]
MGDVVSFRKPAKKAPRKGMCQHGFHKWEVCKASQFDVKQGRLVTVYRCARCGKQKVQAH